MSSDPRVIPLWAALVSSLYFLGCYIASRFASKNEYEVLLGGDDEEEYVNVTNGDAVDSVGNGEAAPDASARRSRFSLPDFTTTLHIIRFAICFTLCGLQGSAYAAVHWHGEPDPSRPWVVDFLLIMFYVRIFLGFSTDFPLSLRLRSIQSFTFKLSMATLMPLFKSKNATAKERKNAEVWAHRASSNMTILHLLAWGVYMWLDFLPLAVAPHPSTEGDFMPSLVLQEQIASRGGVYALVRTLQSMAVFKKGLGPWLPVVRLSLLTISGVLVPMLLPTRYVPVDPKVFISYL